MPKCQFTSKLTLALSVFATWFVLLARADAGSRRFTYVYEATIAAPGSVESENWITWKTSPQENRRFNSVNFRNEIEFGVTEHLQAGIYLADWGYRDAPDANEHGFRYQSSAVELIYNLTNPTTDLLGIALYGEVRRGPEALELESKVILQKNLERFVVAYNGTLEAAWEGDNLKERAGEFSETVGVSYEITPAWLLGAELLHEIEFPDWSNAKASVVYAGPNLSYRRGNWWATVTPLVELTGISSEVDVQTRVIFGFNF